MALTNAQVADVRRYMGYPSQGDSTIDESRDFAYGYVSPGIWRTLYHRLNTMRPEEEAVLVTTYLTPLATLEAAIPLAGANLDTNRAAVWERNTNEVQDRLDLFDLWRRRLCGFVGLAPGPLLQNSNTTSLRRC